MFLLKLEKFAGEKVKFGRNNTRVMIHKTLFVSIRFMK